MAILQWEVISHCFTQKGLTKSIPQEITLSAVFHSLLAHQGDTNTSSVEKVQKFLFKRFYSALYETLRHP